MSKHIDFDKRLDEGLSKPPAFSLSGDFADKVVRKIEMKNFAYDRRINMVILLASLGFLVLAAICFIAFTTNEILNQMLDFGGWAVLIGVMVVFIQVLDQRLVKRKMSDTH